MPRSSIINKNKKEFKKNITQNFLNKGIKILIKRKISLKVAIIKIISKLSLIKCSKRNIRSERKSTINFKGKNLQRNKKKMLFLNVKKEQQEKEL